MSYSPLFLKSAFRPVDKFVNARGGNTVIVFALLLPALCAALAMAADFGLWRHNARDLQLKLDAAAIAGAHELRFDASQESVTLAALGILHENGIDLSDVTVNVQYPPASGPHSEREAVYLSASMPQASFFAGLFLTGSMTTTRDATAIVLEPTGPRCILALDPTAPAAMDIRGNTTLSLNGCAIQSNSEDISGFRVGGSASVNVACAYSSGGIDGPDMIGMSDCAQPFYDYPQMKDPYRDLNPPSGISTMPCRSPVNTGGKDRFLPSGRYCSKVSTQAFVELEEGGTFIFDGADFEMKSAHSLVYGRNVTIFFVNGATINMPNGGVMDLRAKTWGDYKGLIMFADRDTTPTDLAVKFTGHPDTVLEGGLYFPTQKVEYVGSSTSASNCTQLIARMVEITGNSTFTNHTCDAMGLREMRDPYGVVLASN